MAKLLALQDRPKMPGDLSAVPLPPPSVPSSEAAEELFEEAEEEWNEEAEEAEEETADMGTYQIHSEQNTAEDETAYKSDSSPPRRWRSRNPRVPDESFT